MSSVPPPRSARELYTLSVEIARGDRIGELVQSRRLLRRPDAGDIVLKVSAAGVNRSDYWMRKPGYVLPPGASDIPGLEACGIIVDGDVGESGFAIGDRVCALLEGGGYAEYAIARVAQCLPVPGGFSDVEGAALPEACFTVWNNVFDRGRLAAGETLLVHGGASGIGASAIQIAAALGHAVYATAGSDARAAAVERLGARKGINYRTMDFSEVILRETSGRGVDVILDMVAGSYAPRNLRCLADEGRLVMIATLGGNEGTIDLHDIIRRRLVVTGSLLRARSPAFKAAIARSLRRVIWPLLEAGSFKPCVHATFPLRDAAKAHDMLERGEQIGKIILTL